MVVSKADDGARCPGVQKTALAVNGCRLRSSLALELDIANLVLLEVPEAVEGQRRVKGGGGPGEN